MKMSVLKLLSSHRCHSCGLNTFRINKFLKISAYSTATEDEVIIPKRIPRGPTDILKALASVTKRDPTATHYKYHDDPYLIPLSNNTKRIYALAQESGRKAAMWIKNEHPELFQHTEAEPPIEAFFPRAQYDETDDLNDEVLQKIIKNAYVNDAIAVYKIMKKRGDEISNESKQALLELVCFFNETEEIPPELIEEKWFSQASKGDPVIKKTWKDNGLAEKLFNELPESAEAYSALIQGMAKYYQIEKAFEYYKLADGKGFVLSPDAYNSLIAVAFYMADGQEQRWEIIENLLKTMSEHGLQPTIHTLNSVLFCLSRMVTARDVQRYALKIIAEVRAFGVLPSLASYAHLLNIFYRDKSNRSYILEDILEDLESRKLTIQDPLDTNFFSIAMEKCRYYLGDKDIAHRINRLLWHDDNYNFIGNSYKEAAYYRNYFFLLLQTELLEDIMKIYDYLVPHIYTPEISVLEELIKTITMNGAVDLYKRIWTDAVRFEIYDKRQIISSLLEGMALNRSPITTPPSEMAIGLADVAWSIFLKAEEKTQHRIPVEWTGKMLGDAIVILLHANDLEKAKKIFEKLVKDEKHVVGVPEGEVFSLYMDACINNGDLKKAMDCIVYCANNGYGETKQLAKKLRKGLPLSSAAESHLTAIAGTDIFKDDEEESTEKPEKKINWS